MTNHKKGRLSRREFLRLAAVGSGMLITAACVPIESGGTTAGEVSAPEAGAPGSSCAKSRGATRGKGADEHRHPPLRRA